MIEKEKKVLLTPEQYSALSNKFKWLDEFEQINYYYMNEYTKEKNITIRIRAKKDKLLLQVKTPVIENGGLHIKKEYEEEVKEIEENISSKRLKELCGQEIGDAKLVGELRTTRKIYNYNKCVQICLDMNRYFDVEDYELEIEYIDNEPAELMKELANMNLFFHKKIKGKFLRFISQYDSL